MSNDQQADQAAEPTRKTYRDLSDEQLIELAKPVIGLWCANPIYRVVRFDTFIGVEGMNEAEGKVYIVRLGCGSGNCNLYTGYTTGVVRDLSISNLWAFVAKCKEFGLNY